MAESEDGYGQHYRNEIGDDPVRKPLNRRFGSLSLFHDAYDLSKQCVPAHF